jgi:hypothetical protein
LNHRPLGYEFCTPFLLVLVRFYLSTIYLLNPVGRSRCFLLLFVATGRNSGRTSADQNGIDWWRTVTALLSRLACALTWAPMPEARLVSSWSSSVGTACSQRPVVPRRAHGRALQACAHVAALSEARSAVGRIPPSPAIRTGATTSVPSCIAPLASAAFQHAAAFA